MFGLEPELRHQWDGMTPLDRIIAVDGLPAANAYLRARREGRLLPRSLPKIGNAAQMHKVESEARRAGHERQHAAELAGDVDRFDHHAARFAAAVHGAAPADPRGCRSGASCA